MKYILAFLLIASCASNRLNTPKGYAYTISKNFAGSESESHFLSSDSFLVQFILKKNVNKNVFINQDSETVSITYDTIGIEMIIPRAKTFYSIDRFEEDFKLLKTGRYPDESMGYKVEEYTSFPKAADINKDTVIGNDRYKIESFEIRNRQGKDSISGLTYWGKPTRGLFSIFSLKEIPDSYLSPYGYRINLLQYGQVIEARVSNVTEVNALSMKKAMLIFEKINKQR